MPKKVRFSTAELAVIQEQVELVQDMFVDRMVAQFGDRAAVAVGVALAWLFATAMTSDIDQQRAEAEILNSILGRWAAHPLPWRLVQLQG